ncbi:hypothetical protein [Streptomonospora arabica]|uniref:LytR/CpsA/Psr regulator C-terminal domain-containing protein n=1 Tax=Streptomonospora arabica TaxID=412417 RepID=A0ABV9SQ90_9ACTN
MRIMNRLRARPTMVVLVAVLTVGLVATGAIGLFDALDSADSGQAGGQTPAPGNAASPVAAPGMDALGDAPKGAGYTDFGEQCPDVECVRIVGVTLKDGEHKQDSDKASDAAIDKVFKHLLDNGWARVLPNNEQDPDEVPLGESYLTDGQVLITATPVNAPDASAGLMLMHAQEPDS